MKLDERRIVEDALVSEKETCLGAVFCTYTFDPAYFEEQVLRAVLKLRGDPEEEAVRYHEEARRALQETPVVCLIDASVRQPGRRLPYDVHLVRRRTFHPKVFLVLYETEARIAVGSGNMTRPGLEQNTELFFVRSLRYDDDADVLFLRDVATFLGNCSTFAETRGTQLVALRRTLSDRIAKMAPAKPTQKIDASFVSSFGNSILQRFDALLPPAARITRVGLLAPFFEQDDLEIADREDGLGSVLTSILGLRESTDAELHIGAPWDDAPVVFPERKKGELAPSLDEGTGKLWAWLREDEQSPPRRWMEYFLLESTSAKRIQARTSSGAPCRFDRDAMEKEIADGTLWQVRSPTVHAPKTILESIATKRNVQMWIHPTTQLSPTGKPQRRPLHAKVFVVATVHRGRTATYVMMGSANASRAALVRNVEQGSNVEAGILVRLDDDVQLNDLLPTLVHCSLDALTLVERDAPVAQVDLSTWIEDVVHDATKKNLIVEWKVGSTPLGKWLLRYGARDLASGDGAPIQATLLDAFELDMASAELTLVAGDSEWSIPIRVADLAALPTTPALADLGLRELLALLGRRLGAERLGTVRAERGDAGVASALDAIFGDGFDATDVFRAWRGVAEDLRLAPTVTAFRHRLVGRTGLQATWILLRDIDSTQLSQDEVWIYGCELLRALADVMPRGADAVAKTELLNELMGVIRVDLQGCTPADAERPWLTEVSSFYGVEANR